ncbi:MAG: LysM peptidoglycan-binding domain-containing protein, partial [Aggregatilineales bacterium]
TNDTSDVNPTPENPAGLATEAESIDAQSVDTSADGATPTIVIIELSTATPQPASQATSTQVATLRPSPAADNQGLLATATEITVITPDLGSPAQLEFPTATATSAEATAEVGNGGIDSTSEEGTSDTTAGTLSGECVYTIQTGDNLFRVAIDNNISLNELLTANNLTENSIIQPGDDLIVPGCDTSEAAISDEGDAMEEDTIETPGTPVPEGVTIHRVASGETLSVIARQYGVSIQSIVDANALLNPNSLSIGQELAIPES